MFHLNKVTRLSHLGYKVNKLDETVHFYRHILGFALLREENDTAFLGVKDQAQEMLTLIELPDINVSQELTTGVDEVEFTVPSQTTLNQLEERLLKAEAPLEKSSGNLYTSDPEGNQLVFRVAPDAQEVGEENANPQVLPSGTKIGTVHIRTLNFQESRRFFEEILVLPYSLLEEKKVRYVLDGQTDLALAQPEKTVSYPRQDETGLDYLALALPSMKALEEFRTLLHTAGLDEYFNRGKQILQIESPNGLNLWFYVPKKRKSE